MQGYTDLIVWQKSMDVVVQIYALTKKFPNGEQFGLVSQMRRAAVSIPSNIAEGSRRSKGEHAHFFRIAFGSASELETQIEISRRLVYISEEQAKILTGSLEEVLKMLNKMIHYT